MKGRALDGLGGWRGHLALAAMLIGLYGWFLANAFHFDDFHSLVENPHIRDPGNLARFFVDPALFSRNPGSEMYRPLLLLSYALNYALGAYEVQGYRLFNLALHVGAACLALVAYRRIGAGAGAAFAGAALFGLTPLATEPVNYISSRSESMALCCVLGAFVLYSRESPRFSPWALALGAAGLLCKSTAAVLPGLLWAYEALVADRREGRWRRLAPYIALVAVYVWGTREIVAEALGGAAARPWAQQAQTQAKALAYYAKLLVFPWPLSVEHQFWVSSGWTDAAVWASAGLAGALVWCCWRAGVGARFWAVWCLVALSPTLVVPLNVLVNERRLYPAAVGFAGLLVCLVAARPPRGGWAVWGGIACLCLGALSAARSRDWSSEESLWLAAQKRAPLATRPYMRLGSLYRENGDLDRARAAYARALELDPEDGAIYNNQGTLAMDRGDLSAAETAFRRALERAPAYPEAMINLGTLYSRQGRHPEALVLFERARPLGRQRVELHNNLGITYLRLNRFAEAETALRQALALGGDRAGILFNLGGALEGGGRDGEAAAVYREAIAAAPRRAKPYFNLARLMARTGQGATAVEAYRAFLARWQGAETVAAAARRELADLEQNP